MYCMQYDVRFSKFFQVRCYVLIFIRPPPHLACLCLDCHTGSD
uniref:Uncharacterized protein n=1 Tax=Anguilla anguilla TaxID=7936 RepID=A0A0E9URY6_ANGAN